LTESLGTVLENVQLSQLNGQQLDELALLVAERGVVFFRNQDLTTEQQVKLFEHYGTLDRHPAQADQKVAIRLAASHLQIGDNRTVISTFKSKDRRVTTEPTKST
jgi:sulfonate dioxygenase